MNLIVLVGVEFVSSPSALSTLLVDMCAINKTSILLLFLLAQTPFIVSSVQTKGVRDWG